MTVKEVCDLLHKMARQGKIPAFRIGADWRFWKDAIKRWMAEKSMCARQVRAAVDSRINWRRSTSTDGGLSQTWALASGDTRGAFNSVSVARHTRIRPAQKLMFTDPTEGQPPSFSCVKRQRSISWMLKRQSLPT
jgi:excisionase family DNA binding protein